MSNFSDFAQQALSGAAGRFNSQSGQSGGSQYDTQDDDSGQNFSSSGGQGQYNSGRYNDQGGQTFSSTGGSQYNSQDDDSGQNFSAAGGPQSNSGRYNNQGGQNFNSTGGSQYNSQDDGSGQNFSSGQYNSNSQYNDPGQTFSATGGAQYNSPHHRQQQQGSYDTQDVLSHAGGIDDDSQGYVTNAIQHVHDNSHQHQQQVGQSDMDQYGSIISQGISSFQQSGGDISSLMSGGLGGGAGNQLMGHVLKQASNAVGGSGGQDRQSLMNGAAMTLTKLASQNQLSGFVGGSNSGGLGMLESVGGSFLKSQFGQ